MSDTLNHDEGIYGLVGRNIGYSLSPSIHNHVFSLYGMNSIYGLFDLPDNRFDSGISALLSYSAGFNITVPYKEKVIGHLQDLSPEAEKTGSVNLVHRGSGYNTDYTALKELVVSSGVELSGGDCVLFGAGGAGRTAAHLFGELGMRIRIVNRSADRSRKLETELNTAGISAESLLMDPGIEQEIFKSKCVVNAISERDFMFPVLVSDLAVDFGYGRRAGNFRQKIPGSAAVITGEQILVKQAIHSQKIWNGIEPSYSELMGVINVE